MESALTLNQCKNGDEIIMVLLHNSRVWIKSDIFDTHRKVSIGWLTFMSPITTLHNIELSKVKQVYSM